VCLLKIRVQSARFGDPNIATFSLTVTVDCREYGISPMNDTSEKENGFKDYVTSHKEVAQNNHERYDSHNQENALFI